MPGCKISGMTISLPLGILSASFSPIVTKWSFKMILPATKRPFVASVLSSVSVVIFDWSSRLRKQTYCMLKYQLKGAAARTAG